MRLQTWARAALGLFLCLTPLVEAEPNDAQPPYDEAYDVEVYEDGPFGDPRFLEDPEFEFGEEGEDGVSFLTHSPAVCRAVCAAGPGGGWRMRYGAGSPPACQCRCTTHPPRGGEGTEEEPESDAECDFLNPPPGTPFAVPPALCTLKCEAVGALRFPRGHQRCICSPPRHVPHPRPIDR